MTPIIFLIPTWLVWVITLTLFMYCITVFQDIYRWFLKKRIVKLENKEALLKEYQKGLETGIKTGTNGHLQNFIAYSVATTGCFNGQIYKNFVYGNRLKPFYHYYWNNVSHIAAGFKGRIN